MSENQSLPSWDMTNVYPSLESVEFAKDNQKFIDLVDKMEKYLDNNQVHPDADLTENDPARLAEIIKGYLKMMNETIETAGTLQSYIYSFISTDSFNQKAAKALSILQPIMVRGQHLGDVLFKGWVAKLKDQIDDVIAQDEVLQEHSFYLKETIELSKFMMGAAEESLAGELSISGSQAWSKLQNDITSQLKWPIENEDGELVDTPLTAIINLRSNENESMRRRGYEAEQAAWKTVEVPLAAALNGIKGEQNVLFKRRGRQDSVHNSLDQSRIDRQTLEAMLDSMKRSFPAFRKYFKAKAQKLGKDTLPWWDLFAPLGKVSREFTYAEAQRFVLENFSKFSEDLADFADTAFKKNWIDVGPKEGKSAGAFCMGVPAVKESRIMLNFEKNLDWVFTLAHELGHGYHNFCVYQANRSQINSDMPMTLAETASIMCETIVTDAAIKVAADEQEQLAILETALISDSQVVVDIYSRYLFETEVFKRRAQAELSAEEFNEVMEWAQQETYGEGLDPNFRQKYMWTWKPHYYFPQLAFYNYPYTFGQLFGTGLFAIYKERGEDFVPEYKHLLSSTGLGTASELASRFGIDLHSPDFWDGSLKVVADRIDQYVNL
ncbi:MAG: M3 family oligoendopeptidase [Anaerolineales bacterium]|nr:M3 family oligoendopeptidase [Anaerolineales bacterium]